MFWTRCKRRQPGLRPIHRLSGLIFWINKFIFVQEKLLGDFHLVLASNEEKSVFCSGLLLSLILLSLGTMSEKMWSLTGTSKSPLDTSSLNPYRLELKNY